MARHRPLIQKKHIVAVGVPLEQLAELEDLVEQEVVRSVPQALLLTSQLGLNYRKRAAELEAEPKELAKIRENFQAGLTAEGIENLTKGIPTELLDAVAMQIEIDKERRLQEANRPIRPG